MDHITPTGFRIKVVDPGDVDYIGIEIRAWNERFAGSARIFAGFAELDEFANYLNGFPSSIKDERIYEFGTASPLTAGGYVCLRFHCLDIAGHPALAIKIEDDPQYYASESAVLTVALEANDIDNFIHQLRAVHVARSGDAALRGVTSRWA